MKKLCSKILFIIIASSFIYVPASFAAKETPVSIKGATTVDADQVKAWLDNGEDMIILDPRKTSDYSEKGHIPMAVNCPVNTDAELTDKVIKEAADHLSSCSELKGVKKGTKIITYCNGTTCWMSPKAVSALVKIGYTNIFWFRGGMSEWNGKGYPVE